MRLQVLCVRRWGRIQYPRSNVVLTWNLLRSKTRRILLYSTRLPWTESSKVSPNPVQFGGPSLHPIYGTKDVFMFHTWAQEKSGIYLVNAKEWRPKMVLSMMFRPNRPETQKL